MGVFNKTHSQTLELTTFTNNRLNMNVSFSLATINNKLVKEIRTVFASTVNFLSRRLYDHKFYIVPPCTQTYISIKINTDISNGDFGHHNLSRKPLNLTILFNPRNLTPCTLGKNLKRSTMYNGLIC